MQKVREISSGGGGDVVETEACSLIENSGSDGQPVKMSEYWSDVNMWRCTDYKTGCTVLDSLMFADQGLRETSQEGVAIVNASEYERNNKSFGGIISEVVANSTGMSDFQESSFANEIDVFHREIVV